MGYRENCVQIFPKIRPSDAWEMTAEDWGQLGDIVLDSLISERNAGKFFEGLKDMQFLACSYGELYLARSEPETAALCEHFGINIGSWETYKESGEWAWQMAAGCIAIAKSSYEPEPEFRWAKLSDGWRAMLYFDGNKMLDNGRTVHDTAKLVAEIWSFGKNAWQVKNIPEFSDQLLWSNRLRAWTEYERRM